MAFYELFYEYLKDGYEDLGISYKLKSKNAEFYKKLDLYLHNHKKFEANFFDNNKVYIEIEDDGDLTDYLWIDKYDNLVVSNKFKELLEKYNLGNCQFIPLYSYEKNEILCYFVHFYDIFDYNCVDLLNSNINFFNSNIILTEPMFIENIIGELDIFTLDLTFNKSSNVKLSDIYVSERLKKAIEEEGIIGCNFKEVNSHYYKKDVIFDISELSEEQLNKYHQNMNYLGEVYAVYVDDKYSFVQIADIDKVYGFEICRVFTKKYKKVPVDVRSIINGKEDFILTTLNFHSINNNLLTRAIKLGKYDIPNNFQTPKYTRRFWPSRKNIKANDWWMWSIQEGYYGRKIKFEDYITDVYNSNRRKKPFKSEFLSLNPSGIFSIDLLIRYLKDGFSLRKWKAKGMRNSTEEIIEFERKIYNRLKKDNKKLHTEIDNIAIFSIQLKNKKMLEIFDKKTNPEEQKRREKLLHIIIYIVLGFIVAILNVIFRD